MDVWVAASPPPPGSRADRHLSTAPWRRDVALRWLPRLVVRPLTVAGVLAGLVAFALLPVVLFSSLGMAGSTPLVSHSRWPILLGLGAVAVVLGFGLAVWLYREGRFELPEAR